MYLVMRNSGRLPDKYISEINSSWFHLQKIKCLCCQGRNENGSWNMLGSRCCGMFLGKYGRKHASHALLLFELLHNPHFEFRKC